MLILVIIRFKYEIELEIELTFNYVTLQRPIYMFIIWKVIYDSVTIASDIFCRADLYSESPYLLEFKTYSMH